MAADLFVVPTVTFRLLYVLVILAHDRRRIAHVAVPRGRRFSSDSRPTIRPSPTRRPNQHISRRVI
jgi:hypothetical protein